MTRSFQIIILCFLFQYAQAQVITTCEDDPQLTAYRDSLKRYQDHEKWKADVMKKLNAAKTFGEFEAVYDKCISNYNNIGLEHERLGAWTFMRESLVAVVYVNKIIKPECVVVLANVEKSYRNKMVEYFYYTLRSDGKRVLDSSRVKTWQEKTKQ